MPKILHGKQLTSKEHKIWRSAYESAKRQGMDSPGAVATSAVMKYRTGIKKGLKKR